jgi:bacterioferritin-associated ferredoxin
MIVCVCRGISDRHVGQGNYLAQQIKESDA